MKDIAAPQRRVLAYNRVAENKRRARALMAAFALISLPAAAFLAMYLTFFFALLVGMTLGVLTAGAALGGDDWEVWAVVIVGLAVLLSLLTPVLIFWRATYLVLRLSGAHALTGDEWPELRRTVENLCIGSGLPQPNLCVIDAGAANAFSTGLSPESSSLVVTSGLLELLERRELEGVVAQELVQIGNYDTRVGTVLAAGIAFLRLPFTVVVVVFRFLFRVHWAVGGFALLYLGLPMLISIPLGYAAGFALLDEEPAQGAVLLITMSIPVYALVVAPLLAEVIQAGVSRQQQFLADADVVLLVRGAEPLATALVRMDAGGMAGLGAARSTAHLWTVDPLPEKPWWERFWPDHHPPLEERVEMLARMGGGIPASALESAASAGQTFRATQETRPSEAGASPWPAGATSSDRAAVPSAYHLTAVETVVYAAPDAHGAELERLVAGSLVAVHETVGEYLHVITPQDQFGYITKETPMVAAGPLEPTRDISGETGQSEGFR
jgi:heat shock protein HtpX